MGKQVSVYIREDDLDLWDSAVAYASARRLPMSGLVMAALELYLKKEES